MQLPTRKGWEQQPKMSKNTNRSLGEGKITKMVKKYAYIKDDHLGQVHLPLSAAQFGDKNCSDLRERFQLDEHVIFTANKQINQNECTYQAVSVIKPRELQLVQGKITEIVANRFCYVECRKIGKVFVPFSARSPTARHWLGKGAECNREVQLKIFPQPQINNCNSVAYSIAFLNSDGSKVVEQHKNSLTGAEEPIYDQVGIIVECPPAGDLKVFSHMSGFARLPEKFRKNWMTKGRQLRYDAVKQNVSSQEKVHWVIRKSTDLGLLHNRVDENSFKPEQLTIEIFAVINRVAPNPPNRCAWFWNDFIGRIYCYPQHYVPGMNVMECVRCKVVYTGVFDDVPWSAYDIELLGDNNDIRSSVAQMLITRDDWTVTYADKQKVSCIGFLESQSMQTGQCFFAWTDLADSDAIPAVGQKCRATVYYQVRKDKHQWRAVLITPLNPNGVPTSSHPFYSGNREFVWPEPIEAPVVESPSSTSVSSPGFMPPPGFDNLNHIPPPIGAGMKSYNQMVKMNGVPKPDNSPSLMQNGFSPTNGHHLPIGSANAFALGINLEGMPTLPPLESLSFNQFSDSQRGSPMDRNGAGSSMNSDSGGFMHMFYNNGWNQGTNHSSDLFAAFQPNRLQTAGSFVGSTGDPETKEAETQTDVIMEHEVLRDILKNKECLTTILKNFPGHTERLFSMSAAVLR